MKKWMRNIILVSTVLVLLLPVNFARASMFGEEDGILIQILVQAIKQLYELEELLKTGQDSLNLTREINRGINDSLKEMNTRGLSTDPGLYRELQSVNGALEYLRANYETAPETPEQSHQDQTDQVVAEAVTLNNSLYKYAGDLDEVGEQIKTYSHDVSPGGAQKLTAQSLGVVVHVLNQQLRAQATGLKLQAQAMEIQNRKEKKQTSEYLNEANILGDAMQASTPDFVFPTF